MFDIDFIPKNICWVNPANNKKYYTKQEVINADLHPTNFKVLIEDGNWGNYNWEVEPSESFEELLHERCKQLRDKHKYLTLYFSGGADSETMLRAFIEAKVFVDEVVLTVLTINGINPLKDNVLAIEKMKFYAKLLPKTKFTINQIDEKFIKYVLESNYWFNSTFNWSIGNVRRFSLPVLRELGHINTKVSYEGHIVGEIKPKLIVKLGKFYVKMTHRVSTTQYGEWFYCSKELPQLHIKQCHLVKKYFKKTSIVSDSMEKISIFIGENTEYKDDLVKSCRYKHDSSFQPLKAMGLGIDLNNKENTEDSIVYNCMKNNNIDLYNIYKSKVKDSLSAINPNFLDKKYLDLKHAGISEEYYLGE